MKTKTCPHCHTLNYADFTECSECYLPLSEPAPTSGGVRCAAHGSEHWEKRVSECRPTGKRYSSVDEIVAELSPEVQAEYARLRAQEESAPNDGAKQLDSTTRAHELKL